MQTTPPTRRAASLLLAINLYSHSMVSAASTSGRGWGSHRARYRHPDGLHVMLAAEGCNLKNPAFVPAMLMVANGRIKPSSRLSFLTSYSGVR